MRPDSLAIIGLGTVGNTLARHARGAGVAKVVGWSGSRGEGVRALKTNAVDHLAEKLEEAVRGAEMVIVAEPLPAARRSLARIAPLLAPGGYVTTIGSLAIPLAEAASAAGLEARWAASHHLALPEVGTGRDPDPRVLPDAMVYVTPAGPAGEGAAREVMDLWEGVFDARPVLMTPMVHDERLGWLVHLPLALGAALGEVYARQGLGAVAWGVEAKEGTEVDGDPAGVAAALVANREVLLAALEGMSGTLEGIRTALRGEDLAELTRLLESARRLRRGSSR